MNSRDVRRQFEQAFDEYSDGIFRYCYFRIHDRERSKEIMQESFMRAWEYAANGEKIDNIRAFLYRIAHNLVINEYRNNKHNSSLEELSEVSGFDPPSSELSPQTEAEIKQAVILLEKLEPMYRQVMILRYVDDLPVKEIAEILGETESAISVKIHRAIKKLQELIK